ncbi:MAG: hydrogenase maturation nickel metallochaperone HypA [Saprospiraceae bacterium]|nr:hydrogenase maturation nickel metallochaperone HypA [Saprospiraceae bacterium]
MHELSIVLSIVKIAEKEAVKAGADKIRKIELEIGELSGIEMESFNFAWKEAIKSTMLADASKEVQRTPGKARCLECGSEFRMNHLYDGCPQCNNYFVDVIGGKELNVVSIFV